MENAIKKQKLPEWLQKIKEGNEFNKARAKYYPYNEIYLEKPAGVGGKGKYVKLDSYDLVKGEIVSRKYTQFSEITEQTGLNYLKELKNKYPPKTKIANVPSSQKLIDDLKLIGDKLELQGEMILEVPVQKGKIPQSIINEANRYRILIRDINGKIYNNPY